MQKVLTEDIFLRKISLLKCTKFQKHTLMSSEMNVGHVRTMKYV